MADGAAVERVRHPDVIVPIDDAALRKRIALVEDAEQRAVRRELANLSVAKRGVPDVAAAVDTEAVTRWLKPSSSPPFGPVNGFAVSQRSIGFDDQITPFLIDQAAVTAETNRRLSALDLTGDAVEQIEAPATRAAHPDVVVFVDRHVARAERVDLRVVDDALVLRGGDAAVGVRATGVGPGPDVVEAG